MQSHNFQHKLFNPIVKPVQEVLELNVKTIQSFTFINPAEILSARKPEVLLEKNVDTIIQNSHKAIDYMHHMFCIMEKHWFSVSDEVMEHARDAVSQPQKKASKKATKSEKVKKQAVKASGRSVAKNVSKAVKKPIAKKASAQAVTKTADRKHTLKKLSSSLEKATKKS